MPRQDALLLETKHVHGRIPRDPVQDVHTVGVFQHLTQRRDAAAVPELCHIGIE